MTAALKYEWRRITTLRSTWWLSGGALMAGVGLTFLVAWCLRLSSGGDITDGSSQRGRSLIEIVETLMTQFSNFDPMFYLVAYIVAIVGIFSWGHEYRHGMIRATLTAIPQRWSVWVREVPRRGAWVAVVVLATCILSFVVTALWFAGVDLDFDIPALAGGGRPPRWSTRCC